MSLMLYLLCLFAFGHWASCITTALPGKALSPTESSILPTMAGNEQVTDTSANIRELYNSSANGLSSGVSRANSGHCSFGALGRFDDRIRCEVAWAKEQKYDDEMWYCRSSARRYRLCTAMFDCEEWNRGGKMCIKGSWLKEQLVRIRTREGCGSWECGLFHVDTEDMGGWKCKATFDYCKDCEDKNLDLLLDPPDDLTPVPPSNSSTGVVVFMGDT
ncbi:MAG: hypothetical protein Q9212_004948 [Teloschistes hypoglaucus]